VVVDASTPGDYRGQKNFISRLRASGFIDDPAEWEAERQVIALLAETYQDHEVMEQIAKRVMRINVDRYGGLLGKKSFESLLWLAAETTIRLGSVSDLDIFANNKKDLSLHSDAVQCKCGFTGDIAAVADHCFNPETGRAKLTHPLQFNVLSGELAGAVVAAMPPDPNSIICPVCDFWCYISQPQLIDKHLKKKHHGEYVRCEYCSYIVLGECLEDHIENECVVFVDQQDAEEARLAEEAEDARIRAEDARICADQAAVSDVRIDLLLHTAEVLFFGADDLPDDAAVQEAMEAFAGATRGLAAAANARKD
jgi:hypothetical protein